MNNLTECTRCGSTEFEEEDGFYFCLQCQTQTQGFAKEVADEEDQFFNVLTSAVPTKGEKSKRGEKKTSSTRDGFSGWNSIEAFNEMYYCAVNDMVSVLHQINYTFDEKAFRWVSMQLWFKYLRESELAFIPNEHCQEQIKLHPLARHRDNYLLNKNVDATEEPVPLVRINKTGTANKAGFGRNYSAVSKVTKKSNKDYFNRDKRTIEYKDPRRQKSTTKQVVFRPVKGLNQMMEPEKPKEDNFVTYINNFIKEDCDDIQTDNLCDPAQSTAQASPQDNVEDQVEGNVPTESNLEDNFVEDIDDFLKKRMSSKSKKLQAFYDFSYFKQHHGDGSLIFNDHTTRRNVLIFLLLATRLCKLNITLSDIIRWCMSGHICFFNGLRCLPSHWEIMWIDVKSFLKSDYPSYPRMCYMTNFMITHCCIDRSQIKSPDLTQLAERFIKDLNLPRGLILVVKKRYGTYLEHFENQELRSTRAFLEYDVIVIVAVLLSLRDLFGLFGNSEPFFDSFPTEPYNEELFQWSEWIEYSKQRLACIKAFVLNFQSKYNHQLQDIDNILASKKMLDLLQWKSFFAATQYSRRSREARRLMSIEFEKLFFDDADWSNEHPFGLPEPSLYPLTGYTKLVLNKITNPEIIASLQRNFRRRLITPYMSPDGNMFHRKIDRFIDSIEHTSQSYRFLEKNCGDSFKHLLEMATIMTGCQIVHQFKYFKIAETFANNLL